MGEAMPKPEAAAQDTKASASLRLVCPQCKASYRPLRPTRGRRVRCRHCGHVWRHEAGALEAVSGALDTAATTWAHVGSTLLARTDHASSMGHIVSEVARPAERIAAERVGRTLGRYELKAVLGQGAMGHVYEAYDKELKRTVALKTLPRLVDPENVTLGLKMFRQEAEAAAKLQHPNIVTIYEVGEEAGTWYFAMERVNGVTLAKLVDQHGPLPANQACYVLAHAARGLAASHAEGIIHRDVKPGNIMIDVAGHVKVTDFGLADVTGVEGIPGLSERTLGTPGWISPEVARGERATAASDIYGLGLTLYFTMTGKRLIEAGSRDEMLSAQRAAKSVRREQLPESWPPRLRDIAVQCLHADQKDRYQSADTLAADLLHALVPDEADDTVVLGSGIQPGGKLVSPILSWLALGALALVTAVFAIWWWLLK